MSDIIKLNVGGSIFVTLRLTLTKNPESMLARMFESNLAPSEMIDGCYFLDRDPERLDHFLLFI